MSQTFNIRKALEKDLPEMVFLLANDPLGAGREKATLSEKYLEAFRQISTDPSHELMVLEIEGKVRGTFQLSFIPYLTYEGGLRAQIEAVRVHESLRGQGFGKKMFQWAIERAKEKGAHLMQLTTDKKRPEALAFYESLGFKASHEGMKLHF